MKGLLRLLIVLVMMSIVAALTGCGGKSPLVGRWESPAGQYGSFTMEFFSNGSVRLSPPEVAMREGATPTNATWTTDGNRLSISVGDSSTVATFKISGSTLTITDEGGEVTTYKKIK